jgi:hypothetical protein
MNQQRLVGVLVVVSLAACGPPAPTVKALRTFQGTMLADHSWDLQGTRCTYTELGHASGEVTCTVKDEDYYSSFTCLGGAGTGTYASTERVLDLNLHYAQTSTVVEPVLRLEGSPDETLEHYFYQGSLGFRFQMRSENGDTTDGFGGDILLTPFDPKAPVFHYENSVTFEQQGAADCQGEHAPRTDHVKLDLVEQL